MKKRRSRDRKVRHVYPYVCKCCGARRIAFSYPRAKGEVCQRCERAKPNENQPSLLEHLTVTNDNTDPKQGP